MASLLTNDTGLVQLAGWILLVILCLVVIAGIWRFVASPRRKKLGVISTAELPKGVYDTIAQFLPVAVPEELSVHYRDSGVPKEFLFRVDRGGVLETGKVLQVEFTNKAPLGKLDSS